MIFNINNIDRSRAPLEEYIIFNVTRVCDTKKKKPARFSNVNRVMRALSKDVCEIFAPAPPQREKKRIYRERERNSQLDRGVLLKDFTFFPAYFIRIEYQFLNESIKIYRLFQYVFLPIYFTRVFTQFSGSLRGGGEGFFPRHS